MLVSPTEPAPLRAIGKVSLVPEQFGADIIFPSAHFGLVGVQRKEISDLIASVIDGRLAKEVLQMKQLGLACLLIEGTVAWSNDGLLLGNSQWTLAQHQGLVWSMQSQGCWIMSSTSLGQTIKLLSMFERWLSKTKHNSILTRPKPRGEWGKKSSKEWAMHILMGFEAIGPVTAEKIIDAYGLPLAWTVDQTDLVTLEGIGPTIAHKIIASLDSDD